MFNTTKYIAVLPQIISNYNSSFKILVHISQQLQTMPYPFLNVLYYKSCRLYFHRPLSNRLHFLLFLKFHDKKHDIVFSSDQYEYEENEAENKLVTAGVAVFLINMKEARKTRKRPQKIKKVFFRSSGIEVTQYTSVSGTQVSSSSSPSFLSCSSSTSSAAFQPMFRNYFN